MFCVFIITTLSGFCSFGVSTYYTIGNILNSKCNLFILFILFNTFQLTSYKSDANTILVTQLLVNMLILVNMLFLFDINMELFISIFGCVQNTNTNLLNGIMLIHPYILYSYYALTLSLILKFFINLPTLRQSNLIFSKYVWLCTPTHQNIIDSGVFIILLFVSIFLGAWWAEQELSWGG